MSFTETTQQGFLSRIGGSFVGLLLGPVLIIVAVALLWWNEGRAVQAAVGLSTAAVTYASNARSGHQHGALGDLRAGALREWKRSPAPCFALTGHPLLVGRMSGERLLRLRVQRASYETSVSRRSVEAPRAAMARCALLRQRRALRALPA